MYWVSCQNANRANVPASHRIVIGWNSWHHKRFRLWHFGILASWLMANLPKCQPSERAGKPPPCQRVEQLA
jgi:hypothetical protein